MKKTEILTVIYFLGLIIIYLSGMSSMNMLFIIAILLGVLGLGISFYQRMNNNRNT